MIPYHKDQGQTLTNLSLTMMSLVFLLVGLLVPASAQSLSENCPSRTGSSMVLLVPAETTSLSEGDVVTAYAQSESGSEVCVGQATVPSGSFALTVWGNDPYATGSVNGATDLAGVRFSLNGDVDVTGTFNQFGHGGSTETPRYQSDAVYVSSSLSASMMAASIGFASGSAQARQGEVLTIPVRISHAGSSSLSGFQVDIAGEIQSVSLGSSMSGFSLSTNKLSNGNTRVIALNTQGGLAAGTYEALDISVVTQTSRSLTLSRAIGTLNDANGTDAEMSIGQATVAISLEVIADIDGDGDFDLADFAQAIDMALGKKDYNAAADAFPYGSPDGQIDVRDLNVLGRALANGEFPDGNPVIAQNAGSSSFTGEGRILRASMKAASPVVRAVPIQGGFELQASVPVRAARGQLAADSISTGNGNILVMGDKNKFLVYALAPEMASPILRVYASADSLAGARIDVALTDGTTKVLAIEFPTPSEPAPVQTTLSIFPNPTRGNLSFSIPVSGRVIDVLGREVARLENADVLDMTRDRPGIYFLLTDSGDAYKIAIIR
jgi:hypothetical protein